MPYTCNICLQQFKYKKDYTRHINSKSTCFSQQDVLSKYKEAHFIDPEKKKVLEQKISNKQCILCNMQFHHIRNYEKHLKRKNTCIQKDKIETFLKSIEDTKNFNLLLHTSVNNNVSGDNSPTIIGDHNSLTNAPVINSHNVIHNYNFHINGIEITDPTKLEKVRQLLDEEPDKIDVRVLKECLRLMYFDPATPKNNVIAKTDKTRNEVHFMYKDKGYRHRLETIRELLILNFEQVIEKQLCLPERLNFLTLDKDGEYIIDEKKKMVEKNIFTKYMKTALFEVSKEFKQISDKLKTLSIDTTSEETINMLKDMILDTKERKVKLEKQQREAFTREWNAKYNSDQITDSDTE